MLRSMAAVLHVSPGFDPSHVLTAKVPLPAHRYPNDAKRRQFCDALLDRAGRLPGVESASVSNALPMSDSLNVRSFRVDGSSHGPTRMNGRRFRSSSACSTSRNISANA